MLRPQPDAIQRARAQVTSILAVRDSLKLPDFTDAWSALDLAARDLAVSHAWADPGDTDIVRYEKLAAIWGIDDESQPLVGREQARRALVRKTIRELGIHEDWSATWKNNHAA